MKQKNVAIGSPRPRSVHQESAQVLCKFLLDIVDTRYYKVLQEACITDNLVSDVAPDVLICSKDMKHTPILIIEITNRRDAFRVRCKINERILNRFPNIEAFMYNYETLSWESNLPEDIQCRSYSPLLNVDFNDIVSEYDFEDSDEEVTLETHPIRRLGIGNVQ